MESETRWERVIRKLARFGLERGTQELLLGYYCKIAKQTAREIKKDRRTYANADGTETVRQCATWEEAHLLAIEIEEDNAATKAITNPNFNITPYAHPVADGENPRKGKEKAMAEKARMVKGRKESALIWSNMGNAIVKVASMPMIKKLLRQTRKKKGPKVPQLTLPTQIGQPRPTTKERRVRVKEKVKKKAGRAKEEMPRVNPARSTFCANISRREKNVQQEGNSVVSLTTKRSMRMVSLGRMPKQQQERSELLLQG